MNLPNKLTILRVIMIPFFILFMYLDIPNNQIIAAVIFIVASFTDWLDGYIARRDKLVTVFGKFADPLADKILVSTALICLVEAGAITSWIVVVIITREFAVSGLRTLAASENIVIAASWWGKIKTVTQMLAVIAAILNFPFYNILMYAAVFFTIISGVDYFVINKQVFIEDKDI